MAIWPVSAGHLDTLARLVGNNPTLGILILVSAIVAILIYAYQPPVPQATVIAFIPWVVSGSIVTVLAGTLRYPPFLHPVLFGAGAYLTSFLIPGLAWLAMLNFSASNREVPPYHHYIGAMGLGTMVVLSVVLIATIGTGNLARLPVLLIVPLVAFFATGAIAFSIAHLSPDFVVHTAISGSFAVFGWLVNGMSTAMNVAVNGHVAHTPFSSTVRDLVIMAFPRGAVGLDVTLLWVWLFIMANLAIGIQLAIRLAPYAEGGPRRVYGLQGGVGLVGFLLGFTTLMHLAVG